MKNELDIMWFGMNFEEKEYSIDFPSMFNHMCIIFVDTGHKLSLEEIIEQMMTQEPIISDEEAFLRYLSRKYGK